MNASANASALQPDAPSQAVKPGPLPAAGMPAKPRQTALGSVDAARPRLSPPPKPRRPYNSTKRKLIASKRAGRIDPLDLIDLANETPIEKTRPGGAGPPDFAAHTPPVGYLEDTVDKNKSPHVENVAKGMEGIPVSLMQEAMQEARNPRQRAFLFRYLVHGNVIQASKEAGYTERTDGRAGVSDKLYRLLGKPKVQTLLATMRLNVAKKAQYDAVAAMEEAKEAMKFAKETENANAYVKAVELRSKLNGLLIEKMQHQMVGSFTVNIGGIVRQPQQSPDVTVNVNPLLMPPKKD